jgi:hypothetical protein
MNWYKTLDINQKINLKSITELIVGISWIDLTKLFSFREIIEILEQKLKIEGII